MAPRKNTFTDWSDEDSDYELDDNDVNKILIVTQTPPHLRKHPGGDRTGNHESRAKITMDLAQTINDGLYYYEQDLWSGPEPEPCQVGHYRWGVFTGWWLKAGVLPGPLNLLLFTCSCLSALVYQLNTCSCLPALVYLLSTCLVTLILIFLGSFSSQSMLVDMVLR